MDLAAALRTELEDRRTRNPRYSLRAFARDLRVHHGTLSKIVSGRRPPSPALLRALSPKVGLHPEPLVSRALAAKLAQCIAAPGFRPDVRGLAARSNLSIDAVCLTLQEMLASGELRMVATNEWHWRERT
jgi:transcriptional regulator with XRE-family HTH domain